MISDTHQRDSQFVECLITCPVSKDKDLYSSMSDVFAKSSIPSREYQSFLKSFRHSVSVRNITDSQGKERKIRSQSNYNVGLISNEMFEYLRDAGYTKFENKLGFTVSEYNFSKIEDPEPGYQPHIIVHLNKFDEKIDFRVHGWIFNAVERLMKCLYKLGYLSEMPTIHVRRNSCGEISGSILTIYFSDQDSIQRRKFAMALLNNTPVLVPRDILGVTPKVDFGICVSHLNSNWLRDRPNTTASSSRTSEE